MVEAGRLRFAVGRTHRAQNPGKVMHAKASKIHTPLGLKGVLEQFIGCRWITAKKIEAR